SLIILIKQPEITRCVLTWQAICLALFQVSSFKFMERNDPVQPIQVAEPALQPGDQDHQNPLAAPGQTILGSVDRVTYHNEQNGYTVLRLQISGRGEPVTVVGNFSAVSPGESLRVTGLWTTHPQYGDQFKMTDYAVARPATIVGIQKYLGSGLIKG